VSAADAGDAAVPPRALARGAPAGLDDAAAAGLYGRRRMGMTRQGFQRVADLLVERSPAEYRPNPAHRRAKLLACTEAGYWAIRRVALVQRPWADQIGEEVGADDLRRALATLQFLVAVLEAEDS
jgi:hypothetical protein